MKYTYFFIRYFLLGILLTGWSSFSFGNTGGYRIKGALTNLPDGKVYLAMLYGGNQYPIDSATVTQGSFVFQDEKSLQPGVYLIIIPPVTSFLILADQHETDFGFRGDAIHLNTTLQFEGSADNTEYYNYIRYFDQKKIAIDQLRAAYEAQKTEPDKMGLLAGMQKIKEEIKHYQAKIIDRAPGSLPAAIIKCDLPVVFPEFEGSPDEVNMQKYLYQRDHYFDNIDLADERLIRAPENVLVDRVDTYLDHLTPQHADSLIQSVDRILHISEATPASYRFFLTYLFNKYRESRGVGMDAIYVHIAENYIDKGKAPWIEGDAKIEVMNAVAMISPTLIGKTAPDFTVQKEDQEDISLYSVKSPYTILIFWSPNCTHCQQSMPRLNDFYTANKDKGVQVFAVCTKLSEQEKNCWEFLDKNHMGGWINASDKTGGSSIRSTYNIRTTPKIYVLDENKKILAKDIGVEHLEEVMKRLAG